MNLIKLKKGIELFELVEHYLSENQDKVQLVSPFDYYGIDEKDFHVSITKDDMMTSYFLAVQKSDVYLSLTHSEREGVESVTVTDTVRDIDFLIDYLSKLLKAPL